VAEVTVAEAMVAAGMVVVVTMVVGTVVVGTVVAGTVAAGAVVADASGMAAGGAMALAIAGAGRPSVMFGSAATDPAELEKGRRKATAPSHTRQKSRAASGRPFDVGQRKRPGGLGRRRANVVRFENGQLLI
jgi:hypothetical protein